MVVAGQLGAQIVARQAAETSPPYAAPRTTPHKLNDQLSFEEYGDHEDDRRGESVL